MRASTIGAVIAVIVTGVIVADLIVHPNGTKAAGQAIATTATPTYAALLGNVPSGYHKA